jgi:hypothetical protein
VRSEKSKTILERSRRLNTDKLPVGIGVVRNAGLSEEITMVQQFFPHVGNSINGIVLMTDIDDAAAVYPDHDIVMRHVEGPLTIGDFVSAFAEGADAHGGLPTYLRITLHEDAAKIREFMSDGLAGQRGPKLFLP